MLATTCKRCRWMRIYLAIAFGLVLLIGLRPQQAQAVAGLMPDALTLALFGMAVGSAAFVIRLRNWRRLQAVAVVETRGRSQD